MNRRFLVIALTIVSLGLFAPSMRAQEPAASATPKVRIALAGDSTVTDQAGWGAAFAQLLGPSAECRNFAVGGQSSKSFYDQKRWQSLLASQPQYVLIQFGHNDMPGKGPARETDPSSTYPANLIRYVAEARAAGATPILVTPIVRRIFNPDGTLRMELAPWADAVRKVAQEQRVPLVDLNKLSAALVTKLGPEKSAEFDPISKEPGKSDRTHLSPRGAEVFAKIVAEELKQIEPKFASLLK